MKKHKEYLSSLKKGIIKDPLNSGDIEELNRKEAWLDSEIEKLSQENAWEDLIGTLGLDPLHRD